jgi:hypothetical protein
MVHTYGSRLASNKIDAHHSSGTWKAVQLPTRHRTIDCCWVFKIKQNADGSVEYYKVYLGAKDTVSAPELIWWDLCSYYRVGYPLCYSCYLCTWGLEGWLCWCCLCDLACLYMCCGGPVGLWRICAWRGNAGWCPGAAQWLRLFSLLIHCALQVSLDSACIYLVCSYTVLSSSFLSAVYPP